MQKFQTIRFMQVTSQDSTGEALPKGVRRRYEITHGQGLKDTVKPFLTCDIEKSFLRGVTRFHHDGLNIGFLSVANLQGTAWELDDVDNKRVGNISARNKMKSGWQLTTSKGRKFDICDQTGIGEGILRSALGSWPDAYSCIEDGTEIGAIRREERGSGACDRRRSGKPSFLGRLKKLMITHDWVFTHTASITPQEELLLISGLLATIEVTVPVHRSG
ncbi:hypothetical protein [Lentilitoribacter sp. EG35]|uniref:hypothetical protein n=1 Tax=Lentilitoribacter sp. EG35 TaxID=3234192 RepID=UPI003460A587